MSESFDSDASFGSDLGTINISGNLERESEDEDWNPWFLDGDRVERLEYVELSDDDASSVSEGPPERNPQWREDKEVHKEGDYWQIQKLMKFVKVGDQTSTAVALACLEDFDYTIPCNQIAFIDSAGVEILINLVDVNDFKCQLGAIIILSKISTHIQVQYHMINLGALPTLVKHLRSNAVDIQTYAAITIMNLAKQRISRTIVRKQMGIKILMELSDNPHIAAKSNIFLSDVDIDKLVLSKYCIQALVPLASSRAIKKQLYSCGLARMLPLLLKAPDKEVIMASLKLLMKCTSVMDFINSIESTFLIRHIVKYLFKEDTEKDELICKILFNCAKSEVSRRQIGKLHLIHKLAQAIKKSENHNKTKKLKYCLASLWRATLDDKNLTKLDEAGVVPSLVDILGLKNMMVRTYAAGCLAHLTKFKHNQLNVMKVQGLQTLVDQANKEYDPGLLENIVRVIGNCAESPECSDDLDRLEALRIVWSHLDGETSSLQVNAGRALVPIIKNTMEAGEKIRCLEGGMELLMSKLSDTHTPTVAAACAALAQVMTDEENLAILSELDAVEKLTALTNTEDDELRESLSLAIACCSICPANGAKFGRLGALTPIVSYLVSTNLNVVVAAAFALWKLSIESINCITLHRSGVVPFLLECVGSEDMRLQEAAGGCLSNLRQLSFEADQWKHLRGRIIAESSQRKFTHQYTNLLNATTVEELYL